MLDSKDTCAVVGFSPGLGAAVARRFATGGYRVLGLARDPARHAALAGEGIELRTADAGDPASIAAALGGADIGVPIYNAYRMTPANGGPSSLTPEDVAADFQVNVGGALAAARVVLPGMLARGRGTILLTGGGLAFDPTGWLPAASLALGKAALRNLAFALNAELAPKGIHAGTVTVAGMINPGTPFDPDRIAATFWDLHADDPGMFRPELIFKGA